MVAGFDDVYLGAGRGQATAAHFQVPPLHSPLTRRRCHNIRRYRYVVPRARRDIHTDADISHQALHRNIPAFSPYVPVALLPYLAFILLGATFVLAFYFST